MLFIYLGTKTMWAKPPGHDTKPLTTIVLDCTVHYQEDCDMWAKDMCASKGKQSTSISETCHRPIQKRSFAWR